MLVLLTLEAKAVPSQGGRRGKEKQEEALKGTGYMRSAAIGSSVTIQGGHIGCNSPEKE